MKYVHKRSTLINNVKEIIYIVVKIVFEILVLSNKNDYIDVKSKENSFKRSEKGDNLMDLDDDN